MSKKFFIGLFIITFTFLGNAQVVVEKNQTDVELLKSIPFESVYLHTNATMFLVGEYMYYSLYTLKSQEETLSDLSKVAFVELINSDGKQVFEQTIKLNNGRGVGDYFIPTNVASGNYKLVTYTSWMRNNSKNSIFSQNIAIINPYQSSQQQILSETVKDSVSGKPAGNYSNPIEDKDSNQLSLTLDKSNYSNREHVAMEITNHADNEVYYSISVRKVDEVDQPNFINAVRYNEEFSKNGKTSIFRNKDSIYLPDLRGQILKGQIIPTSENYNSDLENTKVALSIPGKQFFLRITNTDSKGNFYFNIDQSFTSDLAKIQILDSDLKEYTVRLTESDLVDFEKSDFSDFKINSSMKSIILERSVHNQIENAFYTKKPDTIKVMETKNLFDGIENIEYDLDDYTRFKTVKETFTEILEYARVRKTGNETYELGVLGYKPYENFEGTPLLIIDGLLVQDPKTFVESYDSRKIDKIKIIRNKYFLGSRSYKGIIIIETYDGDYFDLYKEDNIKEIKLKSMETPKNYFKQSYSESSNDRENIPDFRYQLIWEPLKMINKNSEKLSFFTSDVNGTFEILIQGFTANAEPVSLKKTFKVE